MSIAQLIPADPRLTLVDDREAHDECPLCVETIRVCRMRWRCTTCRQKHVATVCWNCSHILDFGADHGEPHRTALVAAFDEWVLEDLAAAEGRSVESVRPWHEAQPADRHLAQLAALEAAT